MLRELHRKLGRVPTGPDIQALSAQGLMPGMNTFSRYFGGLRRALVAAKLRKAPLGPADLRAKMISQLAQLTRKLGHAPTFKEWEAAAAQGVIGKPQKYQHLFGSLADARSEAGVLDQVPGGFVARRPKATRAEIIEYLQTLARQLGRPPTGKEIAQASREGGPISRIAIYRLFGTLTAAKEAAGLSIARPSRAGTPGKLTYTDEQLLDQLRQLGAKLGRAPSGPVLDAAHKRGEAASSKTITTRFGSWNQALIAAGFPPRTVGEAISPYDREKLLDQLRQLAQRLGHPPTVGDLEHASKRGESPSPMTYLRHFGGIPRARRAAGLE
jgi:hypothetical protein